MFAKELSYEDVLNTPLKKLGIPKALCKRLLDEWTVQDLLDSNLQGLSYAHEMALHKAAFILMASRIPPKRKHSA